MFFQVRAHINTLYGRVCPKIFMNFFLIVHYYLMSFSFKFHKDLSFCYGDIFKWYWLFFQNWFSMYRVLQKNGTVFILQISWQPSIGFSNRFFLLKTEIHMQILNTKPFLCNFRGLRNLQNKIGFLIVVKTQNIWFRGPIYFENY